MSLWSRLFGQKAVTFVPPLGELSSVILGYPNWPIFDSYGEMYRRQPAVRTVVDFLSKNVAQLNPKIYARTSDTDREEWNDHPVAELLREPNPTTTRFGHLRDTVADIAIYDRAYWRMVRSRGLISALVRMPPSRMMIEFDHATMRTTYRFNGEVVTRRDMVVFHGYHPDGGEEGVSPLETLRRVLSEEWAATTHREWYWRNAARQSGVIERPPKAIAGEWSDDAKKRFREQWESTMAGGINSGRTAILEDGMTWNTAAFSPKDSEYIEARKLTYVEVARQYGPSLASLVGEGGATATEANHRHLYQDALAPMLRMLQDEIDSQLLGLDEFDFGPAYCEFNLADKLKGSFEERNRALVTAIGVPYITVNEGRVMDNRPRIDEEWADVPVQPLNVLYGGQPAVTVPTSDPGMQARDFASKLRAFYDEQEQVICSRLGGLKNQGEMTVLVVWDETRWNRDLTQLLPAADAAAINASNRDRVSAAFTEGGLEAVHATFDDIRADVRLPVAV